MKVVAKENLIQIREMLQIIEVEKYTLRAEVFSGASIGQHIRHILEFYLILISGSFSGTINYDKRQRNIQLEEDPQLAIKTINRLLAGVDSLDEKLPISVECDFTKNGSSQNLISSSIGRELAYCIEHSIHHQAIIKAGLIVMGLKEITSKNFGVAYSTIRYREN